MRESRLSQKHWQISVGHNLADVLRGVILHAGMSEKFDLHSLPDEEIYQIKVFKLDPLGERLLLGPNIRGFEFLRVGIKHPDILTLTFFDNFGKQKGEPQFRKSPKKLTEQVKKVLEEILCTFWAESV